MTSLVKSFDSLHFFGSSDIIKSFEMIRETSQWNVFFRKRMRARMYIFKTTFHFFYDVIRSEKNEKPNDVIGDVTKSNLWSYERKTYHFPSFADRTLNRTLRCSEINFDCACLAVPDFF